MKLLNKDYVATFESRYLEKMRNSKSLKLGKNKVKTVNCNTCCPEQRHRCSLPYPGSLASLQHSSGWHLPVREGRGSKCCLATAGKDAYNLRAEKLQSLNYSEITKGKMPLQKEGTVPLGGHTE